MSQSHILVIDDDPAVRQLLAETLTSEGHQVTVMSSGMDGVEATLMVWPVCDESSAASMTRAVRRASARVAGGAARP